MPYKIRIIRDKRLETMFQFNCKKIMEDSRYAVYECEGDIWISPQALSMSLQELKKFYKILRVEGGIKRFHGNQIYVGPKRKRVVPVRLTEGEFAIIRANLEPGETVSSLIRHFILEALRNYRYSRKVKVEQADRER